jgi:transporter family-2 protein
MSFFYYLMVVVGGISVALQQVLNTRLRAGIGSPWWAGFISYLGGVIVMLIVALASSDAWPSAADASRIPKFAWAGGLFGAIFIAVVILMVPRLGVATTIALIVVGQMIGALTFDQFGLLGVPHHPISAIRLAGAACLILGVVLIRH